MLEQPSNNDFIPMPGRTVEAQADWQACPSPSWIFGPDLIHLEASEPPAVPAVVIENANPPHHLREPDYWLH